MTPHLYTAILLCCFCFSTSPSLAKKTFETSVVTQQLKKYQWKESVQNEGKMIRQIHFIRLPVFMPGEAWGDWSVWLNKLHATSRQSMIQKELKVYPKHLWNADDALESERNLRRLSIFTLVRVIPLEISDQTRCTHPKGCIDVAVISRDLWSLRLESNFEYNAGVLNALKLSLTERNFLGQRILLRVPMLLTPFNHTWGVEFNHRRWGPDLSVSAAVNATWNRDTQIREGEGISLQLAHPLYHLDQHWSWSISAQKNRFFNRITQGDQVVQQVFEPSQDHSINIPIQWESAFQAVALSTARQWPGTYQQTLNIGLVYQSLKHNITDEVPRVIQALWYRTYLAPEQTEFGPTISYQISQRRYVALYNISSFGVREDLQVGPQINLNQSFSLLDQTAYIPSLNISWRTLWQKNGFLAFGINTEIRGQYTLNHSLAQLNPAYGETIAQANQWINRKIQLGYLMVTPRLPHHLGRVVHRISWLNQWYNIQNQPVSLGGSNGLRGYASDQFFLYGGNRIQNNLEYRSDPISWKSIQVGGVLFYDSGSVYEHMETLAWKQSIGIGTRLLFPQLNRSVFRIDFATPLTEDSWQVLISASSGQAFAVMPWEDL